MIKKICLIRSEKGSDTPMDVPNLNQLLKDYGISEESIINIETDGIVIRVWYRVEDS